MQKHDVGTRYSICSGREIRFLRLATKIYFPAVTINGFCDLLILIIHVVLILSILWLNINFVYLSFAKFILCPLGYWAEVTNFKLL